MSVTTINEPRDFVQLVLLVGLWDFFFSFLTVRGLFDSTIWLYPPSCVQSEFVLQLADGWHHQGQFLALIVASVAECLICLERVCFWISKQSYSSPVRIMGCFGHKSFKESSYWIWTWATPGTVCFTGPSLCLFPPTQRATIAWHWNPQAFCSPCKLLDPIFWKLMVIIIIIIIINAHKMNKCCRPLDNICLTVLDYISLKKEHHLPSPEKHKV